MDEEIGVQTQSYFNRSETLSAQILPGNHVMTNCSQEDFYQSRITDNSSRKSTKSYPLDPRMRRIRANNRERRRIQAINDAMEALRKVIPNTNNKRKLTKLELLKLAQDYIRDLTETLCTSSPECDEQVVNVNFTYPSYNDFLLESFYTNY